MWKCFFFHKWAKWELVDFTKTTTWVSGGSYTEKIQRLSRTCLRCGFVKVKKVIE